MNHSKNKGMKKIFILGIVAIAVFGCSTEKEDYTPVDDNNNDPKEIQLNAGVLDVTTRAPIAPGANISPIVVASGTSDTYTTYLWSDTLNIQANQSASTAMSFTPKRFYPVDGTSVYLRGYYPGGTPATTTNVVTYAAVDGSIDVLLTAEVSGTRASTPLNFVFQHQLTQLQFLFVAGPGFPATGKTVTGLTINSTQTFPTKLDLNTGNLTYSALPIALTGQTFPIGASAGTPVNYYPMVAPGAQLKLSITTSDNVTYPDATVALTSVVGQAHIITVTFNQAEITTTVSVTPWMNGVGGGASVQ